MTAQKKQVRAPKRCIEADCIAMAMDGYTRCRPHQLPRWAVYNDPAYRRYRIRFYCERCGATLDLTRDHIVPVSKGGSNDPANLRILCRPCNSSKGRTEDAQ